MLVLECLFNKGDLTQVFFCEYCEIFKNSFSYRTPLMADSFFNFYLKLHSQVWDSF